MRIKPSDNWRWYFDENHDRLMLDLGDDMLFRSRFSGKMLTPDGFSPPSFCIDDAALFFTFEENARRLGFSDEQRAELALNAMAALAFLKPQMPKSWFFAQQAQSFMPMQGDIVMTTVTQSGENALLMVIEPGVNATLCLVAQPQLEMLGKTLMFSDAIKVMNDRLFPMVQDVMAQWHLENAI